jgi:hypothetical protein
VQHRGIAGAVVERWPRVLWDASRVFVVVNLDRSARLELESGRRDRLVRQERTSPPLGRSPWSAVADQMPDRDAVDCTCNSAPRGLASVEIRTSSVRRENGGASANVRGGGARSG